VRFWWKLLGREDHLCRKDNSEEWRPDPYLMDERMLIAHVRDLGLIVFSACSHAGIVNVCTETRRLFPDTPIHAVMGGLHLGGVMEHLIPQTVEALKPFDIGNLITGHCTGWRQLKQPGEYQFTGDLQCGHGACGKELIVTTHSAAVHEGATSTWWTPPTSWNGPAGMQVCAPLD
jgi:hypothetical protein